MTHFATTVLPAAATALAPDGCEVRVLLGVPGGSMAHFALAAGQVARAVRHRTVEEIWYVLGGTGELWRSRDGIEEIVRLEAGVCATIPCGTAFQFRALPASSVSVLAVTMPPWPGAEEAELLAGPWEMSPGVRPD